MIPPATVESILFDLVKKNQLNKNAAEKFIIFLEKEFNPEKEGGNQYERTLYDYICTCLSIYTDIGLYPFKQDDLKYLKNWLIINGMYRQSPSLTAKVNENVEKNKMLPRVS